MCEEKIRAPPKKTPHFCATHCCVDCWGCSAPPHHLVTALGLSGNHQPSSCIVMSMLPVVIDIVAGFKLSHRRIFHKCEFTCAPNVTGCAVTKAKPSIEITESRTNTITVGVWIQIQLWVLCRCGVIALTAAAEQEGIFKWNTGKCAKAPHATLHTTNWNFKQAAKSGVKAVKCR